jgi:hypothetical protein
MLIFPTKVAEKTNGRRGSVNTNRMVINMLTMSFHGRVSAYKQDAISAVLGWGLVCTAGVWCSVCPHTASQVGTALFRTTRPVCCSGSFRGAFYFRPDYQCASITESGGLSTATRGGSQPAPPVGGVQSAPTETAARPPVLGDS